MQLPSRRCGVVADWNRAAGTLTAWANFQGPFTLHSVAAGRPRAAGIAAAADHAARLGRQLRRQGGRLHVHRPDRARVAPPRRTRPLDRGPARAPRGRLGLDRAHDEPSRRRSRQTASCSRSRYDVIEDVGAYVRAPEPATLYRMHGSLSGAYRVQNVAARNRVVLTNRCPTGLNRGFGGPQLYLALEGAMTIAAAAARDRPGRAAPPEPDRRRRASRTAPPPAASTTPATTRPASTTRSSSPATRSGATSRRTRALRVVRSASASRASSSRRSRTWATSPSRRPRKSARTPCRSRATPRARA